MPKKRGIIHSTILVTMITFLIKFLGLVKQSVLAAVCGATAETDAFFVGSGVIVSLCIVIFSAISISLLSLHTDVLLKEGREKSNDLINAVLRVFIPISLGITLIFFVFSTPIGKLLAPSYEGEQLQLLSHYIQVMSSAFILWCYYLTINVVLETDKIFIPGKMQGLFQNLFLIAAALLLYPKYGVQVLLYAFLLSGLAQCILVTWCARKQFHFVFRKINAGFQIKQLISLSIPLIIGSAIYEINDIVDKQISTGLGAGNVSYLTYGATINEIVTGVIVSSVSTVLFAHFATWISEGKTDQVEKKLENCIEYLTVLIMPIMAMCIAAGDQIIQILYGRGNFNLDDVHMTYGVVIGYALGFVFQAARANIVKVFYAFQDTKKPMINGTIAVGTNIVLSILLSKVIGVSGIAVATSMAMLLVTVLLAKDVKKYLPGLSLRRCFRECAKGAVAGVAVTAVVWLMHEMIAMNLYTKFITEGIVCVGLYAMLMYLLKSKCIKSIAWKAMGLVKR